MTGAIGTGGFLRVTDDVCGNPGFPRVGDERGRVGGFAVKLHAMAHVIDLVHLLPARATALLDSLEHRRDGQKVVFDEVHAAPETQALHLTATRAVDNTLELVALFLEQARDKRGVGARGTQECLPDRHTTFGQRIIELVGAAIKQFGIGFFRARFGIFFPVIRREQVVPRAGEAIAANTAVGSRLPNRLPIASEAHNGKTRLNLPCVNDFRAKHHHRRARIHRHRPGQVWHISRLPSPTMNINSKIPQLVQEVLRPSNERRKHFAWDVMGIAVDRARKQDAIARAHAQEVIKIHHDAVHRDTSKHRCVAGLLIMEVGNGRLRPTAIAVDDVAMRRRTGEVIRHDLAKRPREKTGIELIDGGVHLVLGRRDAALCVTS